MPFNTKRTALKEVDANKTKPPIAAKNTSRKRSSATQGDNEPKSSYQTPPAKKARSSTDADAADKIKTRATDSKNSSKNTRKNNGRKIVPDVSDITLDGEKSDLVKVYDTCDEVRKKITAHQKKYGVSLAEFGREIGKCIHTNSNTPDDKDYVVLGKAVTSFRQKKGPRSGCTSSCFYGAYVYFEKLRIKEGKPKSKLRQEMENIWESRGGFDLELDASRPFIYHSSTRPVEDKYGVISFVPHGSF